ncbi:hypothetical protein Ga0074115_105112 [endosymbiont of Ridgeia piscesae]|jgi:hypothetical protein|uniref:Uncharacterized protein n=2 Tax=endosymbiont of Ridgeia piscesae TaxID=54398 RepID=A0A0T5YV55_9GAMM|nr:hypothetical protein [endosymbiont of Ridgeia piscesae]KRT54473.1 hypothetical protein Ga0074115_105112 [endosymbiont of Ridgeia piscesae]
MPDTLSGFRQAIQAGFSTRVVAIVPTEERFDQFEGVRAKGNDGVIYVSLTGDRSFPAVAGHELLHDLKRRRPALYRWFLEKAIDHYDRFLEYDAKMQSLLEEGRAPFAIEQVEEELLADFVGDALADPGFLQGLADDNPSKFKQLLNAVVRWLGNVKGKLKGLGSEKYFNDIDGLRKHLRAALNAYAGGKEIPEAVAPHHYRSEDEAKFKHKEPQPKALPDEKPQFSKHAILGDNEKPKGMSVKEVERAIEDFKRRFPGAARLHFVVRDTQESAFEAKDTPKERVKGAYYGKSGWVLLIAGNLSNRSEVERVLAHEVLVHHGLNLFTPAGKRKVLQAVAVSEEQLKPYFDAVRRDGYSEQDEFALAEEVLAYIGEDTRVSEESIQAGFDRFAMRVVAVLRRLGFLRGRIIKSEARQIVRDMAEGVRRGAMQQTFPSSDHAQFSKQADPAIDLDELEKLGLAPKQRKRLVQKIGSLINKDFRALGREWGSRAHEGLFDGLIGIDRAEKAVGVTDSVQRGYVGARLATGVADTMHAILHYGAPEWRDGIVQRRDGTRGLLEVLSDLGGDLNDWLAWMAGHRGEELMSQGRENNLTQQDIRALKARGTGKEVQFQKARKEYMAINHAMLDLAEQAGEIDSASRKEWESDWYVPFYRASDVDGDSVLMGPRTKRGLSHQTSGIKALKDGAVPTNDLLENILTNWIKLTDSAMKNMALLKTVDNLKGSDYITDESLKYHQAIVPRSEITKRIKQDRAYLEMVADHIGLPDAGELEVLHELEKLDSTGFEKLWAIVAPTDPDVIRVMRNGKAEYYRVNDQSLQGD